MTYLFNLSIYSTGVHVQFRRKLSENISLGVVKVYGGSPWFMGFMLKHWEILVLVSPQANATHGPLSDKIRPRVKIEVHEKETAKTVMFVW